MNMLSVWAVAEKTGLCRATIYKRLATQNFPPPVRIDGRVLWIEEEVDAWLKIFADKRPSKGGANANA